MNRFLYLDGSKIFNHSSKRQQFAMPASSHGGLVVVNHDQGGCDGWP